MPHYRAFGLQIDSEISLPELCPADGQVTRDADLVIRRADLDRERPTDVIDHTLGWARDDRVCLVFAEGGQFLACRGRELLFEPVVGVDEEALRHFLLGPMLGVILHQRGNLVLHASAVCIDGSAIAFLAEKGTGKSTLAAAFHAAGHALVSDDVVPVKVDAPGVPIAYPGFPQLKLFPEAAAQLGGEAELLPRLLPSMDKRAARLAGAFPTEPMPLRRIYVLSDADIDATRALPSQQAFMALVRHSFTLPLLHATGTDAQHFQQAVELARRTPVKVLERRRQLLLLPEVVRLVEADLAGD